MSHIVDTRGPRCRGAGKGSHDLTLSLILARGRLFQDSDGHSLQLNEDLLNRCQAARLRPQPGQNPADQLVAVTTTRNARAHISTLICLDQ